MDTGLLERRAQRLDDTILEFWQLIDLAFDPNVERIDSDDDLVHVLGDIAVDGVPVLLRRREGDALGRLDFLTVGGLGVDPALDEIGVGVCLILGRFVDDGADRVAVIRLEGPADVNARVGPASQITKLGDGARFAGVDLLEGDNR